MQIIEFDQWFNLCEAVAWLTVAGLFLLRLPRVSRDKDLAAVCAAAFVLFGISDAIEIFTRAWYRPISLLLLKSGCVAALLLAFIVYRRRKKNVSAQSPPPS